MKNRLSINERWELGVDHHPKSKALYKKIENLDFKEGGDYFCFKSGGDGDNGEHLMYLLDIIFENEDAEEREAQTKEAEHFRQPCEPEGACFTHGRCWTHSAWDDNE